MGCCFNVTVWSSVWRIAGLFQCRQAKQKVALLPVLLGRINALGSKLVLSLVLFISADIRLHQEFMKGLYVVFFLQSVDSQSLPAWWLHKSKQLRGLTLPPVPSTTIAKIHSFMSTFPHLTPSPLLTSRPPPNPAPQSSFLRFFFIILPSCLKSQDVMWTHFVMHLIHW